MIVVIGKSALEVGLYLHCPALHVPRSVFFLSPQQEFHSAPECRLIRGGKARLVQRVEHLAGSIGIACEIGSLRPTAVGTLQGDQFFGSSFSQAGLNSGPFQSKNLHHAVLAALRRLLREPLRCTSDALRDLRSASRHAVDGQRLDGHRSVRKITVLNGRSCPDTSPIASRLLLGH